MTNSQIQTHTTAAEKDTRVFINGLERVLMSKFMQMQVSVANSRAITSKGKELVDFSNCGYLGLENDIKDEDVLLAKQYGLRNGWSRISGNTDLTRALEVELETKLGFESVRLAQSISLINYGIFYSLVNVFPIAIFDRDIHITLKNGLRAAYTQEKSLNPFKHNDLEDLKKILLSLPVSTKKLIVVDGVYSMKGSFAPIVEILNLAKEYNAVLLIDDAHGFAVLGESGYGVIDGLSKQELRSVIYLGSFSKPTSNSVAFVAANQELGQLLDRTAPFLIYSGPPSNLHSAIALRHFKTFASEEMISKREYLLDTSKKIHNLCELKNIDTFSNPLSPIVAIRIQPQHFDQIVNDFYEFGIIGKGVIFPVVRKGDEAVRFTLNSSHTAEQVTQLMKAICELQPLFRKKIDCNE